MDAKASYRELFIQAVKRKRSDYIPFDFDLCPSLYYTFKERTGHDNYKDYFNMPLRFCYVPCNISADQNNHFSRYYDNPDSAVSYSEWGIGIRQGSVAHFVEMLHPMQNLTTTDDLRNYPYPRTDKDYNWDVLPPRIKKLKESDAVVFASMGATIFELSWVLRSMEELLIDMLERPHMANTLLDIVLEKKLEFLERYISAGVDGIQLGDDVGAQQNMILSPSMWREYLKPRLKKIITRAKEQNPDILIEYHSDGNIEPIIPELIEVGVEILNPVQPECMNPEEIKRLYGDRLSFRGCIGTQTVMPFGTPDEVKKTCEKLIETVGAGGGLILSPSHVLEPEVPWENIEAFIETVRSFNIRGGF